MKRKEELTKRLEELERKEFMINMKDHWTSSDWNRMTEIGNEIRKVKEELATA